MITAEEFDEIFDRGEEDIVQYLDLKSARRINQEPQRVNIDFPKWVVRRLDEESQLLGVSRQSLVKMWIAERLEKV
jgi:CRP-like cAMP-binding protein